MAVNSECQVAEDSSTCAMERTTRAWVGQQLLGWSLRGRQYSPLLPRPNVARILRPTRAFGEDNPRLGGAVFMREVVLPLLPRPHVARISGRKRSHVARILRPTRAVREQRVLGRQYLERKTPQSGAYCVPNPRIWEDNPRWVGR